MKKYIIILSVIVIVGVGAYFLIQSPSGDTDVVDNQDTATDTTGSQSGTQTGATQDGSSLKSIGKSLEGRDISAYHFGTGDTELLFIGGIHGGYEWNTSLVALELMDYLDKNPEIIPANVKVTVIPVLNPDGLAKVVASTTRFTAKDVSSSQDAQVSGRFNGNTVDLNRNFDCDWQATGTWQNKAVSGGSAAFSEPESRGLKTYVETQKPKAVVVWFSAAGGVFSSNCHNGVLPETRTLTNTYAKASGYGAYETFNYYEITGDVTNWLAKQNVPAISVLLTNHTDTEWSKNLAGIKALFAYYAE